MMSGDLWFLDASVFLKLLVMEPESAALIPHACQVADLFCVVKFANSAFDVVRRRVQNAVLGHRGYKHDPLYWARELLVLVSERIGEGDRRRLPPRASLKYEYPLMPLMLDDDGNSLPKTSLAGLFLRLIVGKSDRHHRRNTRDGSGYEERLRWYSTPVR